MTAKTLAITGAAMLTVGLFAKMGIASIGGAYLLAASLLGLWYSRASLKHIHYGRRFERSRALIGDSLTLTLSIENRKPLPVIALSCSDEVPAKEDVEISQQLTPFYKTGRSILRNSLYIGSFQKVDRSFRLNCVSRGVFRFGPGILKATDPMGIEEATASVNTIDTLVVYPRILHMEGMDHVQKDPSGDTPDRGWINPDPMQIVGIKPYYWGMPLNQVAWKATAKSASIKAKMTLPDYHSQVMVALSLTTRPNVWDGVDKESLESVVCICASVCNELRNQGVPFGFTSNFPGKQARRHLFTAPGLSNGHFHAVLEYLATVSTPWGRFSETLFEVARKMPASTDFVAIMPNPIRDDWNQLKRLQSEGRKVTAIVLRDFPEHSDIFLHIPVYKPSVPVNWRNGEVISFERLVPKNASVSL